MLQYTLTLFLLSGLFYSEYMEEFSDAFERIEEFVTRDGTDHTSADKRVESVRRQLDSGEAELHFDPDSETCNIVRV